MITWWNEIKAGEECERLDMQFSGLSGGKHFPEFNLHLIFIDAVSIC
jgi:hypothetical protein